jgi:hypothetical protein
MELSGNGRTPDLKGGAVFVGRSGRKYYSSGSSISPYTQPRALAISIVESPVFEMFVNLVIVANCGCMAWDAPSGIPPDQQKLIDDLDLAFLRIFTLEMVLRIFAYGLHCGQGGYLSDKWAVSESP